MSTPTFHGETMSPLFGHATEWTLTYDGRPVHAFMHNPHHETPQFVITAMDTHRKFRQTSKRGRAIVALIREAYAERFAGLHFDDVQTADDEDTAPAAAAYPLNSGETMTDQTTRVTPNLRLGEDEYGDLTIIHDGEDLRVHVAGADPNADIAEMFRILTSMTYTRRDYSDRSLGYWAFYGGGDEFWTVADSLHEVIYDAANLIAMYLTGRNGYPMFEETRTLKAVK